MQDLLCLMYTKGRNLTPNQAPWQAVLYRVIIPVYVNIWHRGY